MTNDEKLDKILETVTETADEVRKINKKIENLEEKEVELRKENIKLREEMLMMKKELGRQNVVIYGIEEEGDEYEEELKDFISDRLARRMKITIALSEIDYARRIGRRNAGTRPVVVLSLIHISEPTRPY